jgi:hypothetical protein
MLSTYNVSRIYIYSFILVYSWSNLIGQNDFSLQDINPNSDTYGALIGPSYFSNDVIVLGFFHEY